MGKGTTKSKGRKHVLDKFYTKPQIAAQCITFMDIEEYDTVIEPSAGDGAFSNQLKNCLAFDIHPEDETITKQDWFKFKRIRNEENRVLVIGNPPFGQQNNIAIKFINHSAQFADTVAFVLPLSFRKGSVQDKLHSNLHLRKEWVLPVNSFVLEGESVNVPSVFQIWDYELSRERKISRNIQYRGFEFVGKEANPDLYIQRIGGKAGTAGLDVSGRSKSSNYFIKVDRNVISSEEFVIAVNKLPHEARDLTVGPRSISKSELVRELISGSDKFSA